MSKRAKVPSADDIFRQEAPEVKAVITEKQNDVIESKQKDAKPTIKELGKEKVTLYFSKSTIDDIETAKFQLRKEYKVKTSNSALVEAAIKKAVADIEELAKLVDGKTI